MIRLKVEESPVFTAVQEKAPKELPLRAALQGSWKPLLLGIGVLPVAVGGYYVVTTFLQSYGVTEVGVSEQVILNGLSVAAFVELVATLGVSWLGDRFGTVRVVVLGLIGVIILAVPQFLVLETGSTALIFLALALMRLVMAATYGPIARVLAQMYPPEAATPASRWPTRWPGRSSVACPRWSAPRCTQRPEPSTRLRACSSSWPW